MKILAVDNELPALNILTRAVKDAAPDSEVFSFCKPTDALNAVRDEGLRPDVAFLDIEMPGTTGLKMAGTLKSIYPQINIVFVTGFSQYALEAMALRPSGYVMKPATKSKILSELGNLRNPPVRTVADKPVFVRCFGNFDVLVNGQPVQFLRAKSKEFLAYLVDRRGAGVGAAELADVLWDDGIYDRSRQKQLSVIRLDLLKSLSAAGIKDMVIQARNLMSVNTHTFDCDYYMALSGDGVAINQFFGEYMMPYSWAEFTTGELESRYSKNPLLV